MKITSDQVLHVARLARLNLSEEQIEAMIKNMNSILDYMEQLNEVDTSGVEPTSHVMSLTNVFREDEEAPSLPREKTFANAPESKRNAFVVPRVI